jgi:hypothetical protein
LILYIPTLFSLGQFPIVISSRPKLSHGINQNFFRSLLFEHPYNTKRLVVN